MRLRKTTSLWIAAILVALAAVALGDDKTTILSAEPTKAAQPAKASEEPVKAETAKSTPTSVLTSAPTPAPTQSRVATEAEAEGLLLPKMQPQSVTVTLINGNTISGTIADADQWTMKTSFGNANLPLSAVAGIRLAQEGNATTTVILHNGDSITGAVQFSEVVVQTDWGRAAILGTHVAAVMFTPGLKWTSEPGLNGVRWKLVAEEVKPLAATAQPAAAQPAATVASQPRQGTTQPPRNQGR